VNKQSREPRTVRRIALGLAMACAMVITSACAAGKQAATANEKSTHDASDASIGQIALRGIAIASPPDGTSYGKGQDALLVGIISNNGTSTDTLTKIASKSAGGFGVFSSDADAKAVAAADQAGAGSSTGQTPSLAKQSVVIKAGERISFGIPGTSTNAVLLTDLSTTLYPATSIQVTFTFAKAGSVTMWLPVQLTGTQNNEVVPVVSHSAPGA
jgi:hypothetical protein